MYITEDGYLWTNAFSWQYLFNIGKDAAGKIIKFTKENSSEATYEPYRNYVTGTIAEITNGYILIDDSVLCKDPADGIRYKVLLDDIRISRFVDKGFAKAGDIVQIMYEGKIDNDNENLVPVVADHRQLQLQRVHPAHHVLRQPHHPLRPGIHRLCLVGYRQEETGQAGDC